MAISLRSASAFLPFLRGRHYTRVRTFEIEILLTDRSCTVRSDYSVFISFCYFCICVQGGRDNSSGYDSTDEEVGLS
jgi:hypothetical protein